ncbi:Pseudouridine synthase I TruA [Gracilaria domingensis]|nr:Pseudouridine synthase I TruA [Gracilaria domingensis]
MSSISSTDSKSENTPRRRFRARVAYDGTHFHGWQFQYDCRSIQGELERAIQRRVGKLIRVVGASRTDSGVHARGQAMHFDIPEELASREAEDVQKFQFTLNQILSKDVTLTNLEVAPMVTHNAIPMFKQASLITSQDVKLRPWHSIYCSTGKLYTYRFSIAKYLDPMQRLYRYHEWRAARFGFSEDILREATNKFIGSHDFSAFTNSSSAPAGITPPVRVNPIRTIWSADVVHEGEDMYRIEFRINGALYRMIRNIMGTILAVSCGQLEISSIDKFFESRDRRITPKSAPAHGLCLEQVFYDDWDVKYDPNLL